MNICSILNKYQSVRMVQGVNDILKYHIENIEASHGSHQACMYIQHATCGWMEYNTIKQYEKNSQKAMDELKIQASKDEGLAICIDVKAIAANIYIPEYFLKVIDSRENNLYPIFSQGEYDSICYPCADDQESNLLVHRVLYCWDAGHVSFGKKLDLFMNDPAWREEAKMYSIFLIKSILHTNKKETNGYSKHIDVLAKYYLRRMN